MQKVTPKHIIIKLLNTSDEKLKSCQRKKTHYIERNKEEATAIDECLCPRPHKFICWNLILSVMVLGGGASGRCSGREGGALMMGLPSLKEILEIPGPFHQVSAKRR